MRRILLACTALALLLPAAALADGGTALRWTRCGSNNVERSERIAACQQLIRDHVTGFGYAWLELGDIYAVNGETQDALASYEHIIGFAKWRAPYEHRGELYAITGDYDKALADAQIVFGLPGSDAEALDNRCWVRAIAGKEMAAGLADCDAALKLKSDSVIMGTRGLILYRMGRLPDAVAAFNAALDSDSKNASALYMRGIVERQNGDSATSANDIAAAVSINPDIVATYDYMGVTLPAP